MKRIGIVACCILALAVLAPPSSAQSTRATPPTARRQSGGGVGVTVDLGNVLRGISRNCHNERRDIKLIHVIAVFGADDDGGRATATIAQPRASGGALEAVSYRPRAPYLSSDTGEDYVMRWIRTTNRVLANSNAPFRLSEDDVVYDMVRNTVLNRQGNDADGAAAQAFFREKIIGASPDPRYAHRMVLFFPWGPHATIPRGSGASAISSWFVSMPSNVNGGTLWNDEEIWGWYMMPHEFGHFMGLVHTFAEPPREYYELLAIGDRNGSLVPTSDGYFVPHFEVEGPVNTGGNHYYFVQQPSPQLQADLGVLQSNMFWDGDAGGFDETTDFGTHVLSFHVAGVPDTPLDIGLGWTPVARQTGPCTARSGTLNNAPYSNITNRTNPMSYSICAPEGMRYTPGQIAVMSWALENLPHRAYFVTNEHNRRIQVCTPEDSAFATRD